jgi:NAD(P)-dependent dehydrogenase (short-subunit alcohol dehydrogenase family)
MADQFHGKVALVTGGSSGIGRAAAIAFAKRGAAVVIGNRREDEGEDTVDMVRKAGGDAIFVRTDVAKSSDVEALIAKAVATFGRLDYACNNAGIEGVLAETTECTEENWDRVIDINLKGTWLCMKYEIAQMRKGGGGAIVNNASIAGMIGLPTAPAYCASKGGVVMLTRTAALEYARSNIRVNVVCPGGVNTPMQDRIQLRFNDGDPQKIGQLIDRLVPMNRWGTSEEIAEVIVWLCSDAASYVTGHAMVVDGGFTAQ